MRSFILLSSIIIAEGIASPGHLEVSNTVGLFAGILLGLGVVADFAEFIKTMIK
jgi:hypothetical protein